MPNQKGNDDLKQNTYFKILTIALIMLILYLFITQRIILAMIVGAASVGLQQAIKKIDSKRRN